MLTKSRNNKKNLTPLKIFERNDRNGNQTKFSYFKCRVCSFFLSFHFISAIVFCFSFKDNSSLSIFNVRSSWQLEKHFFFFFSFVCESFMFILKQLIIDCFWQTQILDDLKKKKRFLLLFLKPCTCWKES